MTHSQFSEFSETRGKAIELGIYNIRKSGCSELDVSYSEGTVRLLLAAHKWIQKKNILLKSSIAILSVISLKGTNKVRYKSRITS